MDRYLDPRPKGAPVALVVGTMNFGKRTSEPEARRIVERALERGLDFFDTANAYNGGESERILGRALKGKRARVATKMGIGRMSEPEGLAPERIAAAIDESLERLGREQVDLYYFHKPDHTRPLEPSVRAMEKLVESGKVAAWGVSNFASWQIGDILGLGLARIEPRVSQVMYNLLVRQLDVEYFKFTAAHPIHTTVYNPLAGGLLAGKLKRDSEVPKGSRFDENRQYQNRYLTDRFFDLAEGFARLAAEAGRTPVELAYQFCASRPGVDSILLGPASVDQLDAAIDAVQNPLPAEVAARSDRLHRDFQGTDASYAR
jgi:aryl-alcohol dehydrogenase-like predicted oxidoreductase